MVQMRRNFTDYEKSKMEEYLAKKAAFKKRRQELLQELEKVEAKIVKMRAKYGAVYNKRNPVLTLPVEVICLIFAFAQLPKSSIKVVWKEVETSGEDEEDEDENENEGDENEDKDDEEDDEDEIVDGRLMEVVVSHVCQRWRSISLGFPKLWTSFRYEARPTVNARPLQRFDIYAERSAALPLRIWFDFQSEERNPPVNPVNAQLVEKAIQHAHRWQYFTMYASDLTVMRPLDLLRDLAAPMLEYLTLVPGIDVYDRDPDSDMITSMDPCVFKGGAPKLTYLMLGASSVFSLPPLSNITILRIERTGYGLPVFGSTPLLELLSLPSLNNLSLCGNIIGPFHATSIHMPNLNSFRVAELDAIWDLLAIIRAPQLHTLVIYMCEFLEGASPPLLDKGYTFPALDKLYLLRLDFEPRIVPALTHMTSQATHVFLSEKNIRTILDGGFAGVVWPWLKTLTCNIKTVETIVEYVTFAKNRPKDLITFHILPCQLQMFRDELGALRAVSLVDGHWDIRLDEPFWPHDVAPFEPDYYDCFCLEIY